MRSSHEVFRGPMVPLITHFQDDGSLDLEAVSANVREITDRGIGYGHGVLLAVGAGGDFPMLSLAERQQVARTIVEAAQGAAPVVVGAQDTRVERTIEMAQFAESIGAEAIQVSAPYYYDTTADDCFRVFEKVIDATDRIGVMAYNTPWEGYSMSIADLDRLAEFPRVVCLKWSTDLGVGVYQRGIARFAERMPVIDNAGLPIVNRLLGGTGYITHLATIWPEHDLKVWEALESSDYATAQSLLQKANWPWYDFRIKMGTRTSGESPVVKAALDLCGRPGGPSRLPSRELNSEEREELRKLLLSIGVPGVC